MEITHLGHSCFKIRGRQATILTDPFDPEYTGLKWKEPGKVDIVTISHEHKDHNYLNSKFQIPNSKLFIARGPGEYEVGGARILGLQTFHDEKQGAERGLNTIYQITLDDLVLVHLGDLGCQLTDSQIDELNTVDILFVPVGGRYTLDAKKAKEVVNALEPLIVIPMHYQAKDLKFELDTVDNFLKELGEERMKPEGKLTVKKETLPEERKVIVI